MTPLEVRIKLLQRLNQIAERLPNGLLQRLVDDAEFFMDWNLKKKTARKSARIQQSVRGKARVRADEEWRKLKDTLV